MAKLGTLHKEMEVFLYGCEICNTVKYNTVYNGDMWCTWCESCKLVQFHNTIRITTKWNIDHIGEETCPVFGMSKK